MQTQIVYIVLIHYHYADTEIDSVYLDKKLAEQRRKKLEQEYKGYKSLSIIIETHEIKV